MKCKIICDLLPLYIDDVCSDETKKLVERHLKECSACRSEYEKMKTDISLHGSEDLDEKELMRKGEAAMTEYVKEKLYRKLILGDTLLNLLLLAAGVAHGLSGMRNKEPYYYYEELFFMLGPMGIFWISDIIYWVRYTVGQRQGAIIDTICKMSVWMKFVLMVCMVAMAAAVGFYTMANEWAL